MHRKQNTISICYSLLFLLSTTLCLGQSWLDPHAELEFDSKPNPVSFVNLIGANAGKEIGQNNSDFKADGIIKNVRSFHIMGSDFGNAFFPNEQTIEPFTCDCPDVYNESVCNAQICYNEETGKSTYYGFRNWKVHYCDWKSGYQVETIQASLEAIFPKLTTICEYDANFNCTMVPHPCTDEGVSRGYPNKWYTKEEWGGSFNNIRTIAATYAENFAATFCSSDTSKQCLVNVLEVGNEPWGKGADNKNNTPDDTPGVEGYNAICWGVIDGLTRHYNSSDPKKWRMKLSTAAFEAYTTTPGCGLDPNQYIEVMVPSQVENGKNLRSYFEYVSIHNYAFPKSTLCSDSNVKRTPESEDGLFLTLKNMKEWMNRNMPHAKLNITEFGWNSAPITYGCYSIGQANQAAYLVRAFLLAARYDINKAYAYAFYDHPEESVFCSVGFQEKETKAKKKSLKAIEKLNNLIGDKHFISAVKEEYTTEGEVFAFLIGDYNQTTKEGKPTHLVAWKAVDLMQEGNLETYPTIESSFSSIDLKELSIAPNSSYSYLSWDNNKDGTVGDNIVSANGSNTNIKLSGMPILIPLKDTNCRYDALGDLIDCDDDTNTQTISQTELPCDEINITYGNGSITLQGKAGTFYPKMEIINVTDNQYKPIEVCFYDCNQMETVNNLPEGNYLVKVYKVNNTIWELACEVPYSSPFYLAGSNTNPPPCEDKDEDGICVDEDCNDYDANLPKPVGSACNDGNSTTQNDKIQEDGCTCLGEVIETNTSTLSCGEVTVTYGSNWVKLTSTNGQVYPMKVQAKQGNYDTYLNCYNCGTSRTVNDLPPGKYEIIVNYQSCGIIDLMTNTSNNCNNSGGDNDGDGICNDVDCAPNDANLPKPVGSSCDDGNGNTQNDVIQEDGCTCLGQEIDNSYPTLSCGEINITYGNGQIEIEGLASKVYTFSIHNDYWNEIFNCWYNCGHTQKVTNLSPSNYIVRVFYNNRIICETDIRLMDDFNSNALSRNVLELATSVEQQTILLEWLAGGINETSSFTIEKSMDGTNFKPIQEINYPTDYHFKIADDAPDYGVNHYRIKQTFISGDARYSTISSEKYYLDEASITLFPNPARDEINLKVGHFAGLQGEAHIFNRLGHEVDSKKLDKKQLTFNTSRLENGLYFLIIEAQGKKAISRKFMVEHGN